MNQLIFKAQEELLTYIEETHIETKPFPSLMSSVNYSQWMYVQCKACQKKFETDIDVKPHFERVHDFGESLRISL